jgi:molecular chaperone Hsp33
VILRRWFIDDRSVLLTTGDFRDFIEAWRVHARLWDGGYDDLSETLIRQGLAAATMHLVNRPRDEIVAWTLNLKEPPTNLFLTGEARRGIVTGRVFVEGVRTAESSRLYVQTLRARGEPAVSAIDVVGFDVLEIFEQYYARSEQSPARFLEIEGANGAGDRFAMVLGMPGADRAWVESVDTGAIAFLEAHARLLEVRPIRFECGCTPRKMLGALRGIFGQKPDELFRGESSVETTCPRCGRRWRVSREQFEGA